MKKRLFAPALCALLLLSMLSACAPPPREKQSATGFYFDTVITMNVYWQDKAPLDAALVECARYENLLSKTVEGSDVWNLNHAQGARTPVSADTRDILEKALEYSKRSDGKFDVTIAPCVALWDFTSGAALLPDPEELAAAAKTVDYRKISITDDGVQLAPGQTIDLGAIAKGYIADRISDFLKAAGIESGMLNFGGNVQTIGNKPDGSPWNVGIQDPRSQTGESIAVVPVSDSCVVTSGIYERGFDLNGLRYHHLLDPATGMPIQNDLAGVSIFADDSFDGDALSTTLFALGREAGLALAEELDGVEAMFIDRNDKIFCTPGLEGRIQILNP
ncbi:MAG: FAD:protein FMN transferase [Pseudoflavonifractor sp.]